MGRQSRTDASRIAALSNGLRAAPGSVQISDHTKAVQGTSQNRDSIANMTESWCWFDFCNVQQFKFNNSTEFNNVDYAPGQIERKAPPAQPQDGEAGSEG
jgi:hypothetical protein